MELRCHGGEGGLRFLIVRMAPIDAEGRAGGTIKVALELKKGPGREELLTLAGLISVCPRVGNSLGNCIESLPPSVDSQLLWLQQVRSLPPPPGPW